MIRQAFALTDLPFKPLSSPTQLFHSRQAEELSSKLDRLLAYAGMALLHGETGCGKSTVAHAWRISLPPNQTWTATIALPTPTPWSFLRQIVRHFAIEPAHHAEPLLHQVTHCLTNVRDQDRRQPLLIVEEAQALTQPALDTIRYLIDLRPDGKPLLAILLVAQREVGALLRRRIATPFRHRLLFAYHLTGLARDEVKPYLQHHLSIVNAPRFPFTDDAVAAIFNYSQGLPRIINHLAVDALYLAARQNEATIDHNHILAAVDSLDQLAEYP